LLRTLGSISSIAILVWLAITRFTIMQSYYATRPLAQIIAIAMMAIYLISAGMVFLGIKSLVRIAMLLLAALFTVSIVWAVFDLGLDWSNALLLALQAVNLVAVILLYRKASKSQGPSVLDMPIFG
jgi:glucose dehydrogenase